MVKQKLAVFLMVLSVLSLVLGVNPTSTQAQTEPQSVVILVVDEFSVVDLESIRQAEFAVDETCAVNLQGQGYAVRGASTDTSVVDVLHGEVVYSQIETMWKDAGEPEHIKLVQVDTAGLTTDTIAESIREAIAQEAPETYFIINMSFVIVPCENVETVVSLDKEFAEGRAANSRTVRQTFESQRSLIENTITPALTERMTIDTSGISADEASLDELNLDPLQVLFIELGSRAIPIASAGNFGFNYPFWPAAWNEVVSVSASNGTGFTPPSAWNAQNNRPLLSVRSAGLSTSRSSVEQVISNYGEIMLPGEYEYADVGTVIGTSFAAPRLSVILALYLSEVGDLQCRQSQGTPALAYGEWANLTLSEASQLYCPSLLPYLPQ